MSETDRIWGELQRSFEGNEAWKCPSLRDLLAAITAAQAAARAIPGAPTIWELLLHTTAYEELVRRRALPQLQPRGDDRDHGDRERVEAGDARGRNRIGAAALLS